jgi:hypothetical protein
MAAIVALAVVFSGGALVAFATLVVGVRRTDRCMSLRDSSCDGIADTFARRVLGVYVRQPQTGVRRDAKAMFIRVGR